MSQLQSLYVLLKRIWHHFSIRRKRQTYLLMVLMILVSLAEVLNVGSVLPFIGVIVAPERIFNYDYLKPIIQYLNISSPDQLLLPMCIGFGLITLITNGSRLAMLWASTKLATAIGADLSLNAYRKSLYQPYSVHVSRNSAVVGGGIGKVSAIVNTVSYFFTLVGSMTILTAILIAILIVDPLIAILCFGGFGLLYALIIFSTRNQLRVSSYEVSEKTTLLNKALSESFGGIRDIIVDNTQEIYCKIFEDADLATRTAQGRIVIIGGAPRFLMESLSILIILVIAYAMSQSTQGISSVLPILGAIGLGAQRLLPVLQAAYGSWSAMLGSRASIQDSLELLDQALPGSAFYLPKNSMKFNSVIEFDNVSFRYQQNLPNVLEDINLAIPKGSRVGIIGKTGEGKSTLLDLLMGLLMPTSGYIKIDGNKLNQLNYKEWQKNLAHVPQAIFLADASIAENIAFGIPKNQIDLQRVIEAAKKAKIDEAIRNFEYGYDTKVGERGVKLSGGQRQRIGIARAFYKNASVIIFDEATSALDEETESLVMDEINQLDEALTLLIIAHRKSTLKKCNLIIELAKGKILNVANTI